MFNFKLKQLILAISILIFSFGLVGCGKKPVANNNQDQNVNTNTTVDEIDTSSWQTYRNEEYGFEFKYSSDFLIVKDEIVGQWFNLVIVDKMEKNNQFTISNLPIGFENSLFFDNIIINNKEYKKYIDEKNDYTNYEILLDDNKYIIYKFKDTAAKQIIEKMIKTLITYV